jgi:single-stranded-DNA-specific exonuclease
MGNPEPAFVARSVVAHPRIVESRRGGDHHLKLILPGSPRLDAIGFGMAPRAAELEGPVDLAFQASLDTWNGEERVSLKLRDLRAAEPAVLPRTGS